MYARNFLANNKLGISCFARFIQGQRYNIVMDPVAAIAHLLKDKTDAVYETIILCFYQQTGCADYLKPTGIARDLAAFSFIDK